MVSRNLTIHLERQYRKKNRRKIDRKTKEDSQRSWFFFPLFTYYYLCKMLNKSFFFYKFFLVWLVRSFEITSRSRLQTIYNITKSSYIYIYNAVRYRFFFRMRSLILFYTLFNYLWIYFHDFTILYAPRHRSCLTFYCI